MKKFVFFFLLFFMFSCSLMTNIKSNSSLDEKEITNKRDYIKSLFYYGLGEFSLYSQNYEIALDCFYMADSLNFENVSVKEKIIFTLVYLANNKNKKYLNDLIERCLFYLNSACYSEVITENLLKALLLQKRYDEAIVSQLKIVNHSSSLKNIYNLYYIKSEIFKDSFNISIKNDDLFLAEKYYNELEYSTFIDESNKNIMLYNIINLAIKKNNFEEMYKYLPKVNSLNYLIEITKNVIFTKDTLLIKNFNNLLKYACETNLDFPDFSNYISIKESIKDKKQSYKDYVNYVLTAFYIANNNKNLKLKYFDDIDENYWHIAVKSLLSIFGKEKLINFALDLKELKINPYELICYIGLLEKEEPASLKTIYDKYYNNKEKFYRKNKPFEYNIYLALFYYEEKDTLKTIQYFEKELRVKPKQSEEIFKLYGEILYNYQKKEDEIALMYKATNVYPKNPTFLNWLGYSMVECEKSTYNDLEYAKDLILKALKYSKKNKEHIWDSLAWLFYKQKKYNEAKKAIQFALKLKDSVVFYHAGKIYQKLNDDEKAKEYFSKSIQYNSEETSVKNSKLELSEYFQE